MSDIPEWLKQMTPEYIKAIKGNLKYHAYVANSEDDYDFAKEVADALISCGFDVYFPGTEVLFGQDTVRVQADAMEHSRRVIVIQTKKSVNDTFSQYVLSEACCNMVNNGHITVIPILKGTSRNDIPTRIKYVNFVDSDRSKEWFDELCQYLIATDVKLKDKLPFVNLGEGAAWMMFQSFLKNMLLRLADDVMTLCKACFIPEEQACFKFLVVIPASGSCPKYFKDADDQFEFFEKYFEEGLKDIKKPRSTDLNRKLTRSMHMVKDKTDDKWYYFSGEFAGAVKTMHDIMMAQLPGLTTDQLLDQVVRFAVTLEQLADFEQTKPYADKLIIIRFNDDGTDCLSEIVLRHIKAEIDQRKK